MTLRITIELVPYGDESKKRTLDVVDVSNVATLGDGISEYVGRRQQHIDTLVSHSRIRVGKHRRSEGYWELIRRVALVLR